MGKRILIANRGEIAIRVAKAIRELGHVAIGLWTENEENAAHLEYCQEWLKLEGQSNRETYLNVPQIIGLAKKHHVDAIHPGYGFLSENGDFCKRLEEEKIIFIGPHSEAIILMGDKAKAKDKAREAGVPVVPGSKGEVETIDEALAICRDIGFPILLKAVAGGGGRGMRLCQNLDEVKTNFPVVKREAKAAFGYDGMMIEKYIVNPHHIEVQILADKKGHVFHVFERECSIQRRHQKIIEEAPSPFIGDDENLRIRICETAVQLAKHVKYDSAGTVEFIMGEDKNFYFLEMNTRIQVEHAITEEITGLDLVVNMIKSALGEELDVSGQDSIFKYGHSIECRICAEDPVSMLPAPGVVTGFDTLFPQGTRFDHCLYRGLKVTPEFDPMVGKLVVKAPHRQAALRKMKMALEGLLIEGLKTNIPLHKMILENEVFKQGHYTTNFFQEEKTQEKVSVEVKPEHFIDKLAVIEAIKMGL